MICTDENCDRKVTARGYCGMHYERLKRRGLMPSTRTVISGERRHENPLYKLYYGMLDRCYNTNRSFYKYYGGRGLTVDDRWRGPRGFNHFIEDMGERPEGMTIERVDNEKGYGPDNCIWATRSRQQYNQRTPNTNTSGHKGVSLFKMTGRWQAYIARNGKRIHLGYFTTKEEAVIARQEAEQKFLV